MTSSDDRRSRAGLASYLSLDQSPPQQFENQLRDPAPRRAFEPISWTALIVVVVATLLPRMVMAWRIPTICVDGTTYVTLAESFEQGDFQVDSIYRFNLYPLILAILHRCGISWETAGEAWGVIAGTAAVLPLFGWMRRQFNQRVAVVGGLLYAVHPELIEWSPELVRDQTFWLLFTTSCYCLWRAVVEVRIRFFAAAGVCLPAALFCRFEAVFLLIPLVMWTAVRWWHLRESRWRLGFGVASVAAVPIIAATILSAGTWRVTELSQVVYVEPLRRVENMARTLVADESPLCEVPLSNSPPFSWRLAWKFLRISERGLTAFYGLFLIVGLTAYARLFFRSDHLPITLLGLGVSAGIWIHLWFTGEASSRYVLSIAIVAMRPAALCLMRLNHFVLRRLERLQDVRVNLQLAAAAAPAVIAVFGLADAWSTQYDSRAAKAQLGLWIRDECGERCVVAGADEQLAIVGFYARAVLLKLSTHADARQLFDEIDRSHADCIIVSQPPLSDAASRALWEGHGALGFEQVDEARLPTDGKETLFLVRPNMLR